MMDSPKTVSGVSDKSMYQQQQQQQQMAPPTSHSISFESSDTHYETSSLGQVMADQNHIQNLLQQPKYVKVFRKSKHSGKLFQRLFLAQELRPASGQGSPIWVSTFSRDGKYLAVGRADGLVQIWKVISSPLSRLENQTSNRVSRSMSNASSSSKGSAQPSGQWELHDVGPDRTILTCPESSYTINNRVFAPAFEEKPFREFKAHSSGVVAIDWSKNGFLLTGSMDNTAKLWHLQRSDALQEFQHDEFVTTVQFHPTDDRFFLSGCMDSNLRLWSVLDREVAFKTQLQGLITAACFTPDGETCIAAGLGWCSVLETRGLDRKFDFYIKSFGSSEAVGPKITGIKAYNETEAGVLNTKLIITSNDSRIRKYNLDTRKFETKFKGAANDHSQVVARPNEDHSFLVSGSENHWCYIWNLHESRHPSSKDKAKKTIKKLLGANLTSGSHEDNANGTAVVKDTHYLLFHAHHTEITSALFAPIATSKLLELSNDPLYELYSTYNLYSKDSRGSDDNLRPTLSKKESYSSMASELSLHAKTVEDAPQPEISVIITTDKEGSIRIFRRDFVYNMRKALKHDFIAKHKFKKTDNSDVLSLGSTVNQQQLPDLSTDDPLARQAAASNSYLNIGSNSFVPLGLGNLDTSIDDASSANRDQDDEYSLSSNSSIEADIGRSHTAKERPLKDFPVGNSTPVQPTRKADTLRVQDERGRLK